jgi:hypothetical protein
MRLSASASCSCQLFGLHERNADAWYANLLFLCPLPRLFAASLADCPLPGRCGFAPSPGEPMCTDCMDGMAMRKRLKVHTNSNNSSPAQQNARCPVNAGGCPRQAKSGARAVRTVFPSLVCSWLGSIRLVSRFRNSAQNARIPVGAVLHRCRAWPTARTATTACPPLSVSDRF